MHFYVKTVLYKRLNHFERNYSQVTEKRTKDKGVDFNFLIAALYDYPVERCSDFSSKTPSQTFANTNATTQYKAE